MKAEFAPRIDLHNRTALETVIPLDTPLVLFLDPSDACNFKCKFCPTSDRKLMKEVGRPWRTMKMELFEKIVADMKNFNRPVEVLRLYKDGEPLLNKNFPDMIKLAKQEGVCNRVDTTTNASLLTPERGEKIIEAGLDRINISIEGISNEQYKNFSDVKLEFSSILENVRYFYSIREGCDMLVKINGDSLSEDDKKLFLELFGDHCDKIYIEHVMGCWPNFEFDGVQINNDFGIYGNEIVERDVCPYPFYSIAVNSDGIVSVCFLDWSKKLVIGDCRFQPIDEIWQSESLNAYRKLFLKGKRKQHPICGNCGQMSHGMPDNLDPYADEIYKKICAD